MAPDLKGTWPGAKLNQSAADSTSIIKQPEWSSSTHGIQFSLQNAVKVEQGGVLSLPETVDAVAVAVIISGVRVKNDTHAP